MTDSDVPSPESVPNREQSQNNPSLTADPTKQGVRDAKHERTDPRPPLTFVNSSSVSKRCGLRRHAIECTRHNAFTFFVVFFAAENAGRPAPTRRHYPGPEDLSPRRAPHRHRHVSEVPLA